MLISKPTPRRESRLSPTGATPSSGRQIQPPPPEDQLPLDTQHEGASANINTLEGYFTNLSAAATNEKELLNQLVLNNTTLTNSNESLVALVKKHANNLKNLEQELARLKKPQVSARNPPTVTKRCAILGGACLYFSIVRSNLKVDGTPPFFSWRKGLGGSVR